MGKHNQCTEDKVTFTSEPGELTLVLPIESISSVWTEPLDSTVFDGCEAASVDYHGGGFPAEC